MSSRKCNSIGLCIHLNLIRAASKTCFIIFYRLGGYVLDNFPFTREQFTLLIERALIPDSVICLKDDSENGSFLYKRWAELRRAEKHLPDIQEIDDKTEDGGATEKDGKNSSITFEVYMNSQNYKLFKTGCNDVVGVTLFTIHSPDRDLCITYIVYYFHRNITRGGKRAGDRELSRACTTSKCKQEAARAGYRGISSSEINI